jgi:hypothetical protein
LLISCLESVQLDGFVVRIISLNGREWLDRALDARWSRPQMWRASEGAGRSPTGGNVTCRRNRARHEGVPKLKEHRAPGREPGPQPRQFLPAPRQRSPQLGPLPTLTFTSWITRTVPDHGVACTLIHLVSNWTLTSRSELRERTPSERPGSA